VNRTDYAYLAGLIDGDGCILVRRRDRDWGRDGKRRTSGYTLNVKISGETNHLTRLRAQHDGVGSMHIQKGNRKRHLAEWTIAHKRGLALLVKIVPFMQLKRAQAELCLQMPWPRSRWAATPELRAHQEEIRLQIKRLNKLGRGRD
jgi:hypothetical protein